MNRVEVFEIFGQYMNRESRLKPSAIRVIVGRAYRSRIISVEEWHLMMQELSIARWD